MPVFRVNIGEPFFFRDRAGPVIHFPETASQRGFHARRGAPINCRRYPFAVAGFQATILQVYFNFLEGFDPRLVFFRKAPEPKPPAVFEPEDIHGPGDGIDEPGMLDWMQGIQAPASAREGAGEASPEQERHSGRPASEQPAGQPAPRRSTRSRLDL